MNYNYNYYYHSNKKNSKYLDGLSKRIGFVTIIVLLLVVLKISNSYNQNNIINKLEAIYKKDYTSNINTIVLKYKDLPNTFVNNFNSSTENFKFCLL
ncbi:MAG: hypothetical protein N2486_10855, partial [Caloramator sp.]|nr:hypothetical protein [Caloramator sp.]